MITHIATAVLYVADQDASRRFYETVLDCATVRDAEMFPGARWLELRPPTGQTALVLSSAAAFGKRPGEGAFLQFACDDAAATATELRARGAAVSGPHTEPWGTYLTVADPDGHDVLVKEAS